MSTKHPKMAHMESAFMYNVGSTKGTRSMDFVIKLIIK